MKGESKITESQRGFPFCNMQKGWFVKSMKTKESKVKETWHFSCAHPNYSKLDPSWWTLAPLHHPSTHAGMSAGPPVVSYYFLIHHGPLSCDHS